MSDTAALQRSAGRRRPVSFDALPRGAAHGFVPGAILGATGPFWFFVEGQLAGSQVSLTDGVQLVAFVLMAAVVGACFAALVGFVSGLGAVLVPERGIRRNLAVMLVALITSGICFALLLTWLSSTTALLLPAAVYWVSTAAVAYRCAPILDGRPRHDPEI